MWPLDEEALDTLERIRAAYAPLADAGEEGAMAIVQAVEGMAAEAQNWLSRAQDRISNSD